MARRKKWINHPEYISRDLPEDAQLKKLADQIYTDAEKWIQFAIDNEGVRHDMINRYNASFWEDRDGKEHHGFVLRLRQQ